MVKININGRDFEAEPCQTVLSVAQSAGIDIPTLCHTEAVADYGACRICLVEVERRGRKRLVTSCLYPVEEGIKVTTDSERVKKVRKTIIELLLARCPDSQAIREMAENMGVTESRFALEEKAETGSCILCGLCTRVCSEVVGASAISLVNRGTAREVALPFYDEASSCIACGSCAYICPTGAISLVDAGSKRIISWPNGTVDFQMKQCTRCGSHYAPVRQVEYMIESSGLSPTEFELCPDCRKLD
ncbi:4Fe-4S dicluster domain-containing protein [Dehalogenimonas formicexedens]|uniref:4Fe-4S dicluster domain-containing protein n=1 Tax=Dehalogenimonas formicexedens TaxID=1839801 RepID=A0A1P8F6S7_9CHLR|nr:2Fe-2S iron-sulfur cluster-binding protein [Dehalogenimonas formicexedens]APV44135.1 4Fe-4S dicluster domain-containing protein [Dehalogenimonas formicexedens]